jgi:DNA replicative helicase MCM subunit Mcm2 (Cdc46/Mcm family)
LKQIILYEFLQIEGAATNLAAEMALGIAGDPFGLDQDSDRRIQVQIASTAEPLPMRLLDSNKISKLVRLSGIVISASTPVSKPASVYVVCRACALGRHLPVNSSFGGVTLPRTCPG